MKNEILLRRRSKIIIPQGTSAQPPLVILTLQHNLRQLGYVLDADVCDAISRLDDATIGEFATQLIGTLRKLLGAHVKYTPMYPNFPQQVMEMDEAELYLNAALHYFGAWAGWEILPKYEKKERPKLIEKVELRVIGLGSDAELKNVFQNMFGGKGSLSPTDQQDLEWGVVEYATDLAEWMPRAFALKENLAVAASLLMKHAPDQAETLLLPHFKTATDVLRLITGLSGGDVSLAENTKFRKFSRKERRLLLALLDHCGNITEDMIRQTKRWMRVGERLHPGEYAKAYPKAAAAFEVVRNKASNQAFPTFNRTAEDLLRKGNMQGLAQLLKSRPGEFARKLDLLIRQSPNPEGVIYQFSEVAGQVSTPVLLQVWKHFQHRDRQKDIRVFFPKGLVANAYSIPDKLPPLPNYALELVVEVAENALIGKFAQKGPLGKVFIAPELKQYKVPFAQRSAAKALRTVARGSRFPIPDSGDTLRFFIWWHEGVVNEKHTGQVDIDLSAVMYDENWRYKKHISYTNLRSAKYNAAHSGDIVTAPNGASEFIDLHMPSILEYGGRYVVACILSYSAQPFCDLPECFGGWMLRRQPGSGEIYEPQTVQTKIDIAANTRFCIPVIMDLAAREVIWCDLALNRNPRFVNNVDSNQGGMIAMGKAMTGLVKPTLFDLLQIHAAARGILVNHPAEADIVFNLETGVSPFAVDEIMANWL